MRRVESEVDVYVEVSESFKVCSFDVEGGDGRMMRNLFEKDGDSTKYSLKSFTEDGIEGLESIGKARVEEDIAHSNVLHLFDGIVGSHCFGDELREVSHHVGDDFKHRFSVKDLNRQRHVHDGFACHQVRTHLLQNHLQDSFLSLYCLLVAKHQISTA